MNATLVIEEDYNFTNLSDKNLGFFRDLISDDTYPIFGLVVLFILLCIYIQYLIYKYRALIKILNGTVVNRRRNLPASI